MAQAACEFGTEYAERVYAGVLGKVVGVYLGRPFEGWLHEQILDRLGEVQYYVHEQLGVPLVVTDDDISGTFTFVKAIEDYGFNPELTARQIGQTWLNYLIENRTILWWGGMGMSTEHTAFLRLKHGIPAPESGSIARNGKVVAEQIGSQIFIDGWGLVNPGDPERAAHYAQLAASVSHDGEAVYGAQVVAALVAQAFVEHDMDRLLDVAVAQIPSESLIATMIGDIREWHAQGHDWRAAFHRIERQYGYDKYGGNCHIVPNHALIVHALLHCGGDFQKALMIVNTCGWDTDCNSGNVGCIMGVRGGLEALEDGPDWRTPVADRLYLPTADGGSAVTDAATQALSLVNVARRMRGMEPLLPKGGARFHFALPGSVQGFECDDSPESKGVAQAFNFGGSLLVDFERLTTGRAARIRTETFPGAAARKMDGYAVVASPTLYPGQTVRARVTADADNLAPVEIRLYVSIADSSDGLRRIGAPTRCFAPGETLVLEWTVPDSGGYPVCEAGIEILSDTPCDGMVLIDWLTWDGTPKVDFVRCEGKLWREAWVNGLTDFSPHGEPFRMIHNEGTGLLMQGTREWTDYRVSASVTPHLAESCGIAARVQGMKRYYALLLDRSGEAKLVRAFDGETVLDAKPFPWTFDETHEMAIEVEGGSIRGFVDGKPIVQAEDTLLTGGGVAFVLAEGRMASDAMRVRPLAA